MKLIIAEESIIKTIGLQLSAIEMSHRVAKGFGYVKSDCEF